MTVSDRAQGAATLGPSATILATEHWSLLGTRAMVWNEAMSRTGVFLTVLSAAVVALALAGDATGFSGRFAVFALVLLSAVLFLGLATFARLVQINALDGYLVLAMNRLRHGYLDIAPELEHYFTASQHDDWAGVLATDILGRPPVLPVWTSVLVDTPTVVATLDAAIAATLAALVASQLGVGAVVVVTVGLAAFAAVWTGLFMVQVHSVTTCRRAEDPRFPTPPKGP